MKRWLLGLVVLFCFSAVQAQQDVQGVTDTEIIIGNWGPQSGPAAAWGTVTRAIDAYFQYINDQGGIHGRELVLVSRDDGYDPARTVAAARELNERVGVFAFVGGVGTANGLAVLPYIQRNQIPWVSPATGSGVFAEQSNGLIFSTFTNYETEAALLTRYAVEELGVNSIAMFYQNDDFGKAGLRGVEAELARQKEAGADVFLADAVSYERGATNMAVQALRLKGSGADTVVMFGNPSAAASLLSEFAKLDYHPQILATVALLDPSLLADPGMQGALFSSFLKLPSVFLGEGNGAPVADKLYKEVILQYAPQDAASPFFALAGIAFAQPLVEALRAAGPDLTRESFLAALESMDGYDEGLFNNLSFVESYQGNTSIQLLQVTPEGLRPVSEFIEL